MKFKVGDKVIVYHEMEKRTRIEFIYSFQGSKEVYSIQPNHIPIRFIDDTYGGGTYHGIHEKYIKKFSKLANALK